MKRTLALVVLVLLLVPTFTSAAPASRWVALNTALTPVNVALRDDAAAFANDIADAATASQDQFFASLFNVKANREAMAKLSKALDAIQADLKALKQDGLDGIDALDGFAVEGCFSHFWATEYAMFSSWVATIASLQANQNPEAVGAAIYLAGLNPVDLTPLTAGGPADLEWDRVVCAGAKRPHPATPSASSKPSAAPSGDQG